MGQEIIKSELEVNDNKIKVITIDNKEFISLTDLARYANQQEPKIPIQTWMINKDVIAYLGLWEKLNNENFKGYEFATFENLAGKNSFYMSPQKWIKETNAIGIISGASRKNEYPNGDVAINNTVLYCIRNYSGELKWDSESKEMRFFDLDNLPQNQNDPDLIEIYRKSLNK